MMSSRILALSSPDSLPDTSLARRTFLQYCALAGSTVLLPARLRGRPSVRQQHAGWKPGDPPDATMMHALAQRAIEAAMAAGASYADVRVTHTLHEVLGHGKWENREMPDYGIPMVYQDGARYDTTELIMGVGVRAFVRGYWGFASSPYWTADEAIRLGQEAAGQAHTNAQSGAPRLAELGTIPIVKNGHWVMPGIDPFTVPIDEKIDWLQTVADLIYQHDRFENVELPNGPLRLQRDERVFASSEGTSYTQIRYRSVFRAQGGAIQMGYQGDPFQGFPVGRGKASWNGTPLFACGWEYVRDLPLDTLIPQLIDEARQHDDAIARVPIKPVDIGKYDVVFDADVVTDLLFATVGMATQLDRALGFEANAGGTSYLGPDPLQYLGTAVASPLVTVTANRTTPGAVATTQWDDEGVAGQEFPLIQNGMLVDYQTTREQAHWLEPWYRKQGMTVQSRGCAYATTALDCPIQMPPNLVLHPGRDAVSVDDLIKDTARGIYIPRGEPEMDFQVLTGLMRTNYPDPKERPREIRNGRLGAFLDGVGLLFTSPTLWKNVVGVGGPNSTEIDVEGGEDFPKGDPSQESESNCWTVPMKVKECTIIDARRSV